MLDYKHAWHSWVKDLIGIWDSTGTFFHFFNDSEYYNYSKKKKIPFILEGRGYRTGLCLSGCKKGVV